MQILYAFETFFLNIIIKAPFFPTREISFIFNTHF